MVAQVSSSASSKPGDVLRSLVFYPVFYTGTIGYVLAAMAMLSVHKGAFQKAVVGWTQFHRFCVEHILRIRVVIEGDLPRSDTLIAIKHESFFEAIDAPNMIHYPAIIAKAELLRIPFWGKAASTFGLIGVERDQGAKALRTMLAEARRRIKEGRVLVIFPEGTRVPHGRAAPLAAGFAGLYKLFALPVVPVAVDSGPLYHRLWKRSGTVTVRVGEPIPAGLPRDEIEARVLTAINALNPVLVSPGPTGSA